MRPNTRVAVPQRLTRLDTAGAILHFIRVHRTAEQLLEFDRLREILARFTTCALGRREVVGLALRTDRAELETGFALIREAVAYLRAGAELGFG